MLAQIQEQLVARLTAEQAKQIEAGKPAAAQTIDIKAELPTGRFPKKGIEDRA